MINKSIKRAIAVTFLVVANSLFGNGSFRATFSDIKGEFLNRVYWFLRQDQLDSELANKIDRLQQIQQDKHLEYHQKIQQDKHLEYHQNIGSASGKRSIYKYIKFCRNFKAIQNQKITKKQINCHILCAKFRDLLNANSNANIDPILKLSLEEQAYLKHILPKYGDSF